MFRQKLFIKLQEQISDDLFLALLNNLFNTQVLTERAIVFCEQEGIKQVNSLVLLLHNIYFSELDKFIGGLISCSFIGKLSLFFCEYIKYVLVTEKEKKNLNLHDQLLLKRWKIFELFNLGLYSKLKSSTGIRIRYIRYGV